VISLFQRLISAEG